jgi:hypothetical protein
VIVDHAAGLHEGVADRGADEVEALLAQRLGHGFAFRRLGRHLLQAFGIALQGLAADELPKPGGEGALAPDNPQIRLRVLHAGGDLGPVAHQALVLHQLGLPGGRVAGDLDRIETVIGLAIVLALAQHGDPGEACLAAFQNQKLEQGAIVAQFDAPFAIVIVDIERIVAQPAAARLAIGKSDQ